MAMSKVCFQIYCSGVYDDDACIERSVSGTIIIILFIYFFFFLSY